ncbi:MAG TPA: histidine kinase [Marmoricola sp.]|nr:histidine kinase [Marmoricola sp.]
MDAERLPTTSSDDVWSDATRLTRRRLIFDLGVAAGFGFLFGAIQLQTSSAMFWATEVLAAGLLVRRVSAPLVMLAAVTAALIQVVSGEVAVLGDLAFAPLAFSFGASSSSLVRRSGLVGAVLAVAGAGFWSGIAGSSQLKPSASAGAGVAAVTAVVVGGGWMAGYVQWQRRQAVQARVDAAIAEAEQRRLEGLYLAEQQRGRIAADMHDLVAHSWAVVAAQADGARYVLHEDPSRAEDAMNVIGETARSAMIEVRTLLAELRDGAGPDPAGAPIADRVIDRMRQTGLVIEHARHGSPAPGPVADAAGYVLTEALTNALKHGDRGQPVVVVEDWRDGYALRVANGVPEGSSGRRGNGYGLRGMAERIAATGGRIATGSEGTRWVVSVEIPVAATR